ncbi:MAG: bifunctional folylpolyglutamate synthase/dihydrofolate synthase [Turicibacter sp.]|nr:bifunctional folylpolyglutamate synthase/dihydrofolate synthase [Turicibacter sp.]
MFRSGQEVVEWISEQLRFGIRPGLERMEVALERLNNPHLKIQTLHIAGTNGKGSTVTYLRSVLQDAGYQVGTFTSPYIETFHERISLNGVPISDDDLAWCANVIKPIVEEINQTEIGPFTEFEIITLLSFIYFKHRQVDVVIYEVGLGGRFDATNVISPIVCGITNIGHDHEAILGDTLIKIAHEKLGIVKEGVPLFTTEENIEVLTEFEDVALKRHSVLTKVLEVYKPTNIHFTEQGMVFDWPGLAEVNLLMKGKHQIKNATLAYAILQYLKQKRIFNISDVNIYRGMKQAFWKGRFEVIHDYPAIILDGAHNLEGMTQLCETVKMLYPGKRHLFMVSILKDKDYKAMLDVLGEVADYVYFTTFDYPRAQSAKVQYEAFNRSNSTYSEDFNVLIDQLFDELEDDDCLIITGSLYFISQVRKTLIK